MKIRCAWCKPPRIIGEKEPYEDTGITDTICEECQAKYFPQTLEKEVTTYD